LKTTSFLLLTLTIIPLTLCCQNADTTKPGRISIGISFSPDYCYRFLNSRGLNSWVADSRDTSEIPKFGYTVGVNVAWRINNRICIEAGLLYSDQSYQTKNCTLFDLNTSGKPDTLFPAISKSTYHYIYLDIPVKVNYYLLIKRAKLYITGGISLNIFLAQKSTLKIDFKDDQTKTYNSTITSGLTKINLAAIAGFGFSYDVTKRIYFKIEPVFRCSITPIVQAPLREYLYSIGLNTGLYYRL
jgi:Outer membrane protein beta-barrel domain